MSKSSRPASGPIPIISSIAPLAAGKAVWFVDIWGVMHNGVEPYAAAVEACKMFRQSGGLVLLLSNAPRPAPSVAEQLARIGVSDDAYDTIVSSGDASRKLIADLGSLGVFHLGPERDRALYDEFRGDLTTADKADAIVCSGLFDDETETPEDYRELLEAFARRGVAMICANPDIKVERGGKLIYCAGAVARLFEDVGGKVTYAGKPYLPIYDLARAHLAERTGRPIERDEILAIGDGLHTDIEGAGNAGIVSVFIASAVHVAGGKLENVDLADLFKTISVPPIAVMEGLAWS